tara:strand:- start:315 stop:428 length:114 start_codon:yes stop_codon:yes gene_type:complete
MVINIINEIIGKKSQNRITKKIIKGNKKEIVKTAIWF